MKTLRQLVQEYTEYVQKGEIQIAYRGILEFVSRLKSDIVTKNPQYNTSGIYQGYMDMTYFSLGTKSLDEKGLKLAVVYLHDQGAFEVWLSARNRNIAKKYEWLSQPDAADSSAWFHDRGNLDAIIECSLTASPDFDDPQTLIETIEQGVNAFAARLEKRLEEYQA